MALNSTDVVIPLELVTMLIYGSLLLMIVKKRNASHLSFGTAFFKYFVSTGIGDMAYLISHLCIDRVPRILFNQAFQRHILVRPGTFQKIFDSFQPCDFAGSTAAVFEYNAPTQSAIQRLSRCVFALGVLCLLTAEQRNPLFHAQLPYTVFPLI